MFITSKSSPVVHHRQVTDSRPSPINHRLQSSPVSVSIKMVFAIIEKLIQNYLNNKIVTDNFVFRLHYQITVIILVVFSLMVTSTQLFSRPIQCYSGKKNISQDFINTYYCWTHSTFIVINESAVDEKVNSIFCQVKPTKNLNPNLAPVC